MKNAGAREQNSRPLLSEGGFSLLEALMVLGMIAVAAGTFASFNVQNGKMMSRLQSKMEWAYLRNAVQEALANSTECKNALVDSGGQPVHVNLDSLARGTPIPIQKIQFSGETLAESGVLSGGLRVTKIELQETLAPLVTSGNIKKAPVHLRVSAESYASGTAFPVSRVFTLDLSVNASTQEVVDCRVQKDVGSSVTWVDTPQLPIRVRDPGGIAGSTFQVVKYQSAPMIQPVQYGTNFNFYGLPEYATPGTVASCPAGKNITGSNLQAFHVYRYTVSVSWRASALDVETYCNQGGYYDADCQLWREQSANAEPPDVVPLPTAYDWTLKILGTSASGYVDAEYIGSVSLDSLPALSIYSYVPSAKNAVSTGEMGAPVTSVPDIDVTVFGGMKDYALALTLSGGQQANPNLVPIYTQNYSYAAYSTGYGYVSIPLGSLASEFRWLGNYPSALFSAPPPGNYVYKVAVTVPQLRLKCE